ncbi:HD domain-containing phosphohydrolase [Acetobacterium wieringae]|uniref:HD domain-containing phosphohydrolase n=1 Tax=Acetobacterium wieringae TaxID=52694 RepID=UPI0026EF38E1|nr:HD domain-containing phosphohydrolase [Acetobacterium wieringae]
MKLKYKTIIIALCSATVLLGVTYGIFYWVFYGYVDDAQQNQMDKDFEMVETIIDNEKETFTSILIDWAFWDDTYNYINDHNLNYVTVNLNDETMENLNLNMMLFIDQNGVLVGSAEFDLTEEQVRTLLDKIMQNNFYSELLTEEADSATDLMLLEGQPYLIAVGRVSNSSHNAVSNGSMVMVKTVDDEMTTYIESLTGVNVELREAVSPVLENQISKREFDGKPYLTASRLLPDSSGEEIIVMTISRIEENYSFIKHQFNLFMISFIGLLLLILSFDYFIVNRYFLKRIEKLIDFTKEVGIKRDTTLSISMEGQDELKTLADSTNQMLQEIDQAHQQIKMMDERYRLIMEATNDGYLDVWLQKKEAYISPEWKQLIGYQGKDGHQLYEDYFLKIHGDCKNRLENSFMDMLSGKVDYFEGEYRVMSELYGIIWVSHRGKVVQRDQNNEPIRFISTLSNITRRKTNEEEILFLSYSDPLTRLKNRTYMKKQFEALSQQQNPHYFIIMCDINGLKLTNDAFGHQEGDQVIVAVSNVLRRICRPTDFISRWPGDEFVILLKDIDQEGVCQLIREITDETDRIRDFHLNISLAMGYAESNVDLKRPEDVLNLAENRMYRNKLMESSSSRNATIRSLARTLHEKSTETEAHTMRITQLSKALGSRLNLRKDQLDELELLSLLHDIGKIGIPEYILDKPAKLSKEEWEIIKTHPEIGYRIAKSTPALEHIAEDILAHHEKYDGSGYPNGLKGEAIPYLGRIINVIDSFDVMTHSRSYKKASDLSYAISELKSCSGTQFDPEIVRVFLKMIEEEGLPIQLEISV